MTTQSSPIITEMKVIPVAGHDSMLLNIGGAHNAWFTRNIVVLTDNAGHTGVGEAPGGEVIYQTLLAAIPQVVGQEVARLNRVVQQVHKGNQAADFDTFGKGAWTFELKVNAVAALEAALLDLLGQVLNVPVCELLGPGKQRDAVTVLGYLFYIGDRQKTDLGYLDHTPGDHEWYRLRHQQALSSEAVVRLAEAAQDRYGFKDFKLKGGVLPGEQEIDTARALKKRFPGDIRDEAFCGHLVTQAVKGLGGLDILVNNAGRQQFCESIEELTTEDFDATFKTNVYAMFWITKAAIPHLSPDSVIINTSSVQAYEPSEILLDYAQTKAAIVAFTKSLAKQLAPKGIRVNAVAPGPYWTVLQCCGGQPQEKVEKFGANAPLGRPGQPVEIAPLYVTLAARENSYTSGQVWCSDGGTGTL
ncbi:SDR family oxidoreductase [Klebsiella pneumoniae]|nr:SDR family oxidoreductase [Klebsiella pneumoniae]